MINNTKTSLLTGMKKKKNVEISNQIACAQNSLKIPTMTHTDMTDEQNDLYIPMKNENS